MTDFAYAHLKTVTDGERFHTLRPGQVSIHHDNKTYIYDLAGWGTNAVADFTKWAQLIYGERYDFDVMPATPETFSLGRCVLNAGHSGACVKPGDQDHQHIIDLDSEIELVWDADDEFYDLHASCKVAGCSRLALVRIGVEDWA